MSETKQPENPQAFPSGDAPYHHGMTLRDYFAAQALQVVLVEPVPYVLGREEPYDFAARAAYAIADAMLRARGAK